MRTCPICGDTIYCGAAGFAIHEKACRARLEARAARLRAEAKFIASLDKDQRKAALALLRHGGKTL